MNFIIIGVAGYIAPKHLSAIKSIGGNLLCAIDKSDSVGIIDSYFPDCVFFTEFERFDRHVYKLQSNGIKIDFVSICSPNYMHDPHIRWALRMGIDCICEKPMVLNPWNIEYIQTLESQTGKKAYSILQLRLHPDIINLKNNIESAVVEIDYQTPRGKWYLSSWKGDPGKSGGLITNIGIHLLDLMVYLFGPHQSFSVSRRTNTEISGTIKFANASCNFALSIEQGQPKRIFKINGLDIDLSKSFSDLHSESYTQIISGSGFTSSDAAPAINLAHAIRES